MIHTDSQEIDVIESIQESQLNDKFITYINNL